MKHYLNQINHIIFFISTLSICPNGLPCITIQSDIQKIWFELSSNEYKRLKKREVFNLYLYINCSITRFFTQINTVFSLCRNPIDAHWALSTGNNVFYLYSYENTHILDAWSTLAEIGLMWNRLTWCILSFIHIQNRIWPNIETNKYRNMEFNYG